jgi:hypothetical protein
MNFYEQLDEIFPYLVSIRKLENYISVDVEIPTDWKLPKKYIDEKMVVEQKSSKPNLRFLSFAAAFNQEVLSKLFNNLNNIIYYNLEREAKEKLFQNKVQELKMFFDQKNLDDLKDLEFNIKNNFKLDLDEGESGENIELVSEGDN